MSTTSDQDIITAPAMPELPPSNDDLKWNQDDDLILKDWVDTSACFKWLHDRSYKIYKTQYLRQMIPVIVISTLTGAANFALDRVSNPTSRSYASLAVGSFNIIAAMISTVSQFLKTSELKENHNIATKSWDKFNRNLKLELQRHPSERTKKRELFNSSKKEYDRLVELSPDIPNDVIVQFRRHYNNHDDLIKPEVTGSIIAAKPYEIKTPATPAVIETIIERIKEVEVPVIPDPIIEHHKRLRTDLTEKFVKKYKRQPTNEEFNEYLELQNMSMA